MLKKRINSFKYAIDGIWVGIKEEPNLRTHLIATLIVIFAGIFFEINYIEWMIVILTLGLVIGVELTNTSIEEIVNSFTDEVHPSAKKAKDISAGAVLIISLAALFIGIIIFTPYIFNYLFTTL